MTKRRTAPTPRRKAADAPASPAVAQDPMHPLYLPPGPFAEFPGLSHKHYIATEQAPANELPGVLNPADAYVLGGE